jgi:ectoine hydroxylase-related dioxygenase (phytanoyl-CoA dioxygenase family)
VLTTDLVNGYHVSQYREKGYVRLSGLFSPGEIDVLRMTTESLCAHRTAKHDAWDGAWRQEHAGQADFAMVTVPKVHEIDLIWTMAVQAPVLVDAVSALAGQAMTCVASMLIVKPPQHGQAFPPHQDAAYYAQNDPAYMVVGLYLDDAPNASGPVAYLPGSHRDGFRPHERDGKKLLTDVSLADLIQVPAKAGDLVCASIYTVHGSYPNRSTAQRRLVRLGFSPKG